MSRQHLAQYEFEALLGHDATDDELWRDMHRFMATTLKLADAVWRLRERDDGELRALTYQRDEAERAEYARHCALVVQQLCTALGAAEAARGAAAALLHPQCWQPAYDGAYYQLFYRRQALSLLVRSVAEQCVALHQPADWLRRLGRRLHDLCTLPRLGDASSFAGCIDYLLSRSETATDPQVAALLDALTIGDWQQSWHAICSLAGRPADVHYAHIGLVWEQAFHAQDVPDMRSPAPPECIRDYWQGRGSAYAVLLLARADLGPDAVQPVLRRVLVAALDAVSGAARQGYLDMSLFRQLLEAIPESLTAINHFLSRTHLPYTGPGAGAPWSRHLTNVGFIGRLRQLEGAVLWELLSDFRAETWPVLMRVHHLPGGKYLLRLAEEVEQRGLRELPPASGYYHGSTSAELTLASLLGRVTRHNDDNTALVALLQQLSMETLLAILPLAQHFEADIVAALGWDGALALIQMLCQIEHNDPARTTDPSVGVVQRQAVLDVVECVGEERTRILLAAFARHRPAAVLLAQAVLGWNRSDVRRMFGRRNPLAVRALALLPFDKHDDLLKRYCALATFDREANTSAAGRKAAERAAAQAGLTMLALQAGYADATRLEWAMQDQLGAQGVSLGREWEIEGYTLMTTLRNSQPALEVRNGSRLLKRMPSAVTRDYAYREVRATFEQLKDQQRRYQQALVNAMRRGEPLSPEELALLRRNPLATALLERLVLRTADGVFGLYRTEDHSLEGYREERVRIDSALYVAHPYDLAQAEVLAAWQAEIVRRQIVQPFKQVFRELYLLTPAEAEAAYSSSRFAGRRLKGRQSSAILANLGWLVDGYQTATRPFYDLGFAAHFDTGNSWYPGDDDDVHGTTGALTFAPLPGKERQFARRDPREFRLHLADVPPLVLSEVLRDLDLVTVVAHGAEEFGSSREVLQRRGDLVRATVSALGLRNVEVEEPHVRVRGTRACYRVHLANAAIHIESGSYLCIVPAAKTRKATYLPFEESGDAISSELISKVLLLANDTVITDPTILAQIGSVRRAA